MEEFLEVVGVVGKEEGGEEVCEVVIGGCLNNCELDSKIVFKIVNMGESKGDGIWFGKR